ncbi:MAG: hypothetical protein LBH28_06455 [Oscillospiraceae bacterium]|jgi:hypothetical protein|nr:hypothetical protein [Oscillospiraceae bacterium]
MGNKKFKLLRRNVRSIVNDNSRQFMVAMLGSPLLTRLRWAVIILFCLGYRDLIGGGAGGTKRESTG